MIDRINLYGNHFLLGDAFVHLTHLQANQSLEQSSSVVRSWECTVLKHLLSDFTVEFSTGVAEVALHVDELLHLVELTIHLQYRDLFTVQLNTGVAAGQLTAARDP